MFVNLIIGALIVGGVYGLVALGYSLIYKASGLMSFVQGDMLMFGGLIGLTLFKNFGLPFIITLIVTLVVMFVLGMAIERFIIRRLVSIDFNPVFVVIATSGLSIIVRNMAMIIWGGRVLQFPAIIKLENDIKLFGKIIAPESILNIIITIVCMFALHLFMKKTRFGTSMRASAQDPLAAKAVGINVSRSIGVTWGIAAAVAALGGIMYAPVYGISISTGGNLGIKAFAAAVIGGYGNMYGAIIAGFCLGVVEVFISGYVSSSYKDFIAFSLMILFLVVKPSGLFNEKVME